MTQYLLLSRIYRCYHGSTGDIVDRRGGYTESSGLSKENVWILEKITFGLRKQEHGYNNKLKLCIQ
jgi:hypothetical protein